MPSINSLELHNRMQSGETLNLLDVREEIEYHTYNIGGKNIPISKVNENINQLGYNKTDEIIVICKAGLRSETATDLLTRNGYLQVRNLTGGLMALQKLKQQTH
ncbi:rhodanese-like domain-containing protein [Mucilaginibacter flavidus]|uniref:rhodanese-like domain-containing protein n=1 Tax=Mucilaginibacter flavidus TaxID=2949309 RepID=UPI002092FD6F|nr:rhodanese-like domain-containing protein [Mucilaginibacter flavidus]MCO5950206.1 rhodanese-like domain-containing protein [Mucilaginibacter flavidus]